MLQKWRSRAHQCGPYRHLTEKWKFTTIMHPCDIQIISSIINVKHYEDVGLAQTSQPRDELREKSALIGRKNQVTLTKGFSETSVVLSTPCSALNSASFKWTKQLMHCSVIQDRTVANTLYNILTFLGGAVILLLVSLFSSPSLEGIYQCFST